jgi:hypothetical protein
MRSTTRWAASGMGGDNSRSSAAPNECVDGCGAVTETRAPVNAPWLGSEIAYLKDRASPATMMESQAAGLDGDGRDGAC